MSKYVKSKNGVFHKILRCEPEKVLNEILFSFGVPHEEFNTKCRKHRTVNIKRVWSYMCVNYFGYSYPETASLTNMAHSAILNHCQHPEHEIIVGEEKLTVEEAANIVLLRLLTKNHFCYLPQTIHKALKKYLGLECDVELIDEFCEFLEQKHAKKSA